MMDSCKIITRIPEKPKLVRGTNHISCYYNGKSMVPCNSSSEKIDIDKLFNLFSSNINKK